MQPTCRKLSSFTNKYQANIFATLYLFIAPQKTSITIPIIFHHSQMKCIKGLLSLDEPVDRNCAGGSTIFGAQVRSFEPGQTALSVFLQEVM
jgi:hypothetical protein